VKVRELLAELEGVPLDADVVVWSEDTEHFWKPWISHINSSDHSKIAIVEVCFDNNESERLI
jgi:hypothetical protein